MSQQAVIDLDAFFVDLTASREAVRPIVGLKGVAESGDGSVAHVGETTALMGPIPPAESSVRYYQAPSPLLTPGLGVTPVAEKLVSIGSIPKQATSEGSQSTGSLREMIPGVQEQRPAASSSAFGATTTTERREAPQTTPREKAAPPIERASSKAAAVQQPERVREVAKVAPSPAPSPRVEQAPARTPPPTPNRVEPLPAW